MTHETAFAGAISDFKDADYSIVGVPYDGTSSFRLGSKKGPDRIREASYCFEPYLFEYDICLRDVALHDHGDISRVDDHFRLKDSLKDTIRKIVSRKKFPIVLGGEHSISPIVVSALKEEHEDLNVLILDAHLDFRDEYEGMKHSHATTSRRISEIVGLNNTFVYGVRSKAENYASEDTPKFFTCEEIHGAQDGAGEEDRRPIERVLADIDEPVYLSMDMDVVDPSFAPGVGNPEPFGLNPSKIKKLISKISPSFVGVDIVEVCPKHDTSDTTSNLAARFVYEVIGAREARKATEE